MITAVITGGPCSGKTTLVNEFQRRRFPILDEPARKVLEEDKALGVKRSFHELQVEIFERGLEIEKSLDRQNSELVFLDRSVLDTLAYSNLFLGYAPFDSSRVNRKYDFVFLLERFPFFNDGTRIENSDADAQKIHKSLEKTYLAFGYSPIIVPKLNVEERVNLVLYYINSRGENGLH